MSRVPDDVLPHVHKRIKIDPDTQAFIEKDYKTYYQAQIDRIRQRADMTDPEVRDTLRWSIALLRQMRDGEIKPLSHPSSKPRVM
jgi:hypothetical protein